MPARTLKLTEHPVALITLSSAAVLGQMGFFLTAAALPLYLRHVGVPSGRIGLDIGAASVASIVVGVLAGPFLNRHGAKPFLILGTGSYALAALLMVLAPSEGAIVVGRLLQGFGLAIVGPSALATAPLLAPKRIGSAVGILSTISSLPLAAGPPVGLALYAHSASWMLAAAIAMSLGGLVIATSLRLPGSTAHELNSTIPRSEAVAAGPAYVGPPLSAPPTPTLPAWRLVYDRRWSIPLVATALNGIYFGGIVAYLPLYLQSIHGPNAGIFFTADAIGVVALRIPSGMLSDRTRPIVPMLIGFILTVAGLAAFLPPTNIVWLILAGAGTGIGAGLFASGVLTLLLDYASAANRGSAMTLAFVGSQIGGFAGSAGSGLLIGPAAFVGVIVYGAVTEAAGIPMIVWSGWRDRFRGRAEPASL